MAFDRGADGALALGREAAHGVARILHANGDATGAEIVRALRAAVESEWAAQSRASASSDVREGRLAFAEKRAGRFTGQ